MRRNGDDCAGARDLPGTVDLYDRDRRRFSGDGLQHAHAAAVAWIDQQANEPGASELVLTERALVALRARNACMHGQIARALELYDIILSAGRNAQK
jgi:hypothetical protein